MGEGGGVDRHPPHRTTQHSDLGNPYGCIRSLENIGTLLSTFISSTPSHLNVILERNNRLEASAYMVLVANMPYLGPRFQIDPDVSWNDNHLDVFVFSDMSKLDLISYAMQSSGGAVADTRIMHHRVKRLTIHSDPQMPVLADGVPLAQGTVTAQVRHHALAVMAGAASTTIGERLAFPAAWQRHATCLPCSARLRSAG